MKAGAFGLLALLLVGTPLLTGFAYEDNANAIVSTSSAVAGVSGGGVLAVLWMFLRKVDAFFGRIEKHFDAEEKMLGSLVHYVDSLKAESAIEAEVDKRIRENTPVRGTPVEAIRAAIERPPIRSAIERGTLRGRSDDR